MTIATDRPARPRRAVAPDDPTALPARRPGDGPRPPEPGSQQGLVPGELWRKDRTVRADDGAEIAYTFLGPDDGPVLALCAGFTCPDTWWHAIAPTLASHGVRVLLFHYRGIARSTRPDPGLAGDAPFRGFSIERCAGDLLDVLDAEGVERLALAGHSMGVQVMLEAYRAAPGRVAALASLLGPFETPLHDFYGLGPVTRRLYPPVRTLLQAPEAVVQPAWRGLWRALPGWWLARAVGGISTRVPREVFASFEAHAASLHPATIAGTLAGMHHHSAADLLGGVTAPTLVVSGGEDRFCPPRVARRMATRIPGAVRRVLPSGTHGATVEYPELVAGWLLDLLDGARERGRPTPSRPSAG